MLLFQLMDAGGASSSNLGVDRIQFAPCVIDLHLRVDSSLFFIHAVCPGRDFARKEFNAADATAVDTTAELYSLIHFQRS